MVALPALSDLLTVPSQDDALNQDILPELVLRGARITDWIVGGVYRAMGYVVAKLDVMARTSIATLAGVGFEDFVFGFATPPGIDPSVWAAVSTQWAPIIAKQRYGIDQIAATSTKRQLTLTNSTGSTYNPVAGGIILLAPSGNRYILDAAVTIPANGSVVATFRSEFPATAGTSYNADSSGMTWTFVTSSYPGVVATNPAGNYSPVILNGTSTGSLTLGGSPSGTHSVAVKITSTGSAGSSPTAGWSTSVDGGAFVPQSGTSVTNLGGLGINITLTDGSAGAPYFVAGDVFYFQTPGTDLIQAGRDAETPSQLGTRCRALWPMLGFAQDARGNWIPASPTSPAYAALAVSANSQVFIVLVSNSNINNQVVLTVAGQGVLLPATAIANLQSFFAHFNMTTDAVLVQSPTKATVSVGGGVKIYVKASQLAAAQAAVRARLASYFQGIDSQGLVINGRIDHAWIASQIRTAPGVTRFDDTALTITVNDGASSTVTGDVQLPVTPAQLDLAVWDGDITTGLTWAPS